MPCIQLLEFATNLNSTDPKYPHFIYLYTQGFFLGYTTWMTFTMTTNILWKLYK